MPEIQRDLQPPSWHHAITDEHLLWIPSVYGTMVYAFIAAPGLPTCRLLGESVLTTSLDGYNFIPYQLLSFPMLMK
jgi:hypothetical protein